jgi:predicted DNA-binding transcriptional regulator AlpA
MGITSPSSGRRTPRHPAATQNLSPDAMLRLRQIIGDPQNGIPGLLPVGKTQLYALIRRGEFPAPTKVGASSFWRHADVLSALVDLADGGGK